MIPQRALRSAWFVRHRWQGGAALALVLTAAAAPAAAAVADPAPPPAPPLAPDPALADGGDQVVVTARKTSEKLQDVPVAITAISSADLARNDHVRLEDLNQLVPSANVVVTNGHQTSISIRGVGNNPGSDGLENSAGVFLDGVYLGRPGMAATDLIDIKQVEVLRGPQGTLFGKNTTAGLVNITTELPSFTTEFKGQASYGNFNYQQYQASLSGPVSDTLAVRVTGYRTTRDGIVDNITTGRKTSDLGRAGARVQLLWKPTSNLSVRLIGEYGSEQQSSGAVSIIPTWGITPNLIKAKLAATGGTIAVDPRGRTTAVDGPTDTGTRQGAGSAQIDWELGGGFKLTSITAFRYWQYDSNSDTEGSSADVMYGGYHIQDRQWTEELRLALPRIGRVDAVVGLYYFNQYVETNQHLNYGKDAAAWLSGIPNALLPVYAQYSPALAGLLAYNRTRWNTYADPLTHSIAAFGQANWHVTPTWNITAGIRQTHETKREQVCRPTPVSSVTGLPVAALAGQAAGPIRAEISNSAPSFLISSDYHPTPGLMLYALVSRGQKAGGLNTTLPPSGLGADALKVEPEVATNYEAGIKSDLFAHRVQLNLSLFRTDIRNYQANVLQEVNGQVVQLLTNAGAARTQGVEAEATLQPVTGLSLHGYAAYNDATYRSYRNGPCPIGIAAPTCDLSGKPIAGAPKWTLGANGSYEHDIGGRLTGYASAEYSWRSHFYGSLDDSPMTLTGGYGLLNLRLGIRSKDRLWDLSVWGRNVTNAAYATNYFNYGSVLPGTYVAFFGDPATYGATLRFNF